MRYANEIRAMAGLGLTNPQIAKELGLSRSCVHKTNRTLDIDNSPTLQQAFYQRVQRVDGGHMIWTGARDGVTPFFKHDGRKHSARGVAFTIRTGCEPIGTVRAECELSDCVAPRHVEDAPNRDRLRRHLAFLYRTIPTTEHGPERRAS